MMLELGYSFFGSGDTFPACTGQCSGTEHPEEAGRGLHSRALYRLPSEDITCASVKSPGTLHLLSDMSVGSG